jgi:hypothetical protein
MGKIIAFLRNIIFTLFVIIIQTSFIFLFPFPFNQWQIYLSILIPILILFESNRQIIWWGVVLGITLSFFTIHQIFILPVIFVILILLINFILKNFLTNRSFYSIFILSALTTFLYNFIIFLISLSFNYLYFSTSNILIIPTLIALFWQIIFNLIGALIFFLLLRRRH